MVPVRQSEYLLRNLVEAAPDAMIVTNECGQVILVNHQAEMLFGYPREELLNRQVEILIPERWGPTHVSHREKYLEGPSLRAMSAGSNLVARRKDGSEIAVDIMLSPIKDPHGTGIIATVRDATARTRAEQRLATSEAMFRALYDQAPDAIIAVDRQGRSVQCNRKVEEMFGFKPEELLNQPIEILVPDRFRKLHTSQRQGYTINPKTRPMGVGLELLGKRKDGSEFPVDILLSPVQVPGSDVVISVIRDITERKKAERDLRERAEQLARSNQELEQFAYVASHDLQEPLRAVAASCQVMQRRLAGKFDEDTNEYIQFAIDGAKRMQELIHDLLSYSRAGRGKEFESVNVSHVLQRVLENLTSQVQETKAAIRVSPMPTVQGDPSLLAQLLQNLLSNALKFRTEQIPEVQVAAVDTPEKWIFSVQDNGIGIPKEYQEKVFVIFQRLHRREDYPGTGIGLAICKKIVECHGGTIWLESEPGVGSTFYFTIPKPEVKHAPQTS